MRVRAHRTQIDTCCRFSTYTALRDIPYAGVMRPRLLESRPLVLDLALALATALVTASAITADVRGPGDRPIDWTGWLLVPTLAGLLLFRRKLPVTVLLSSVVALLAYYIAGYPPVGLELPLAAAFFSTAEAGKIRFTAVTGMLLVAYAYGYRLSADQDVGRLLGYELSLTIVILTGAVAAGDAVRLRRRRRAEAEQMAALTAQTKEQEALRIVETERSHLARDVHDVLGHTVSVIQMQADIATEAFRDDPVAAEAALNQIGSASRSAMDELRSSLKRLRSGDENTLEPVPGLEDLNALVNRFSEADITVTPVVRGETPSLSTAANSTAYRVIQEALTNTIRHSNACHVEIDIAYSTHHVTISVHDDGDNAHDWHAGEGITGMRERVILLGGHFQAGPVDRGFVVHVEIPAQQPDAPM